MIIAYLVVMFLFSVVKLFFAIFAVSYILALIIECGAYIKRGFE